jgi:hypothetical protein
MDDSSYSLMHPYTPPKMEYQHSTLDAYQMMETFIRLLYEQDEGLNVSITNTQSTLIQVAWEAFHVCPCSLQIWAKLENPRPIENICRCFKSENT